MNLELSDEERLLQQTARDFAESEVKPLASELGETGLFPRQNLIIASWLLHSS
jgi:alkylation response protein AidB-like acyl-CoA dehydrogenase